MIYTTNNSSTTSFTIDDLLATKARFDALPKIEPFEIWVRRDVFEAMQRRFGPEVELAHPGRGTWHGIDVIACLPDDAPITHCKMPKPLLQAFFSQSIWS